MAGHDVDKGRGGETTLARRDMLKALTGVSVVAATAVAASDPAEAQAARRESRDERRKARYQANSPHVQAFYRTNRY